tara:strand:- start:45 stop:503 length:459 start_codon:yes stop_codon:yes gene_type:complete
MPIKTFRGKIKTESKDTISLHTNNGSVGYKIKKFDCIAANPAGSNQESVILIHAIDPGTTTAGVIDLSDQSILGCAFYDNSASTGVQPPAVIIMDQMIFNQDIYITHNDKAGSESVNYYLELEQVKLDLNENTTATLKDIRNIKAQNDATIL